VKGILAQDVGVVWGTVLRGDWMVFWGEVEKGPFNDRAGLGRGF